MADLAEVVGGELRLNFHAGQLLAWNSKARFVLMLAGTQGGKTSFGPHWLLREIQSCGQGDYLVVAPTFSLLDLKALPAFLWLFQTVLRLGRYTASPSRKFVFSPMGERRLFGKSYNPLLQTRVLFGYATEPESLESATAKAAWLDEAGQRRFKQSSWEAIRRRLSLSRGRVLITTSLYCENFVKTLWDKWRQGDKSIDVVQFESVVNPAFSRDEFEDARGSVARWKFRMQYQAQWEKPAGLVYDCFDTSVHRVPRFALSPSWRRVVGVDFGTRNMAAVFAAVSDDGAIYIYREYHQSGESVAAHVRHLRLGELSVLDAVGGAPSEDEWRRSFGSAGLGVRKPRVSDRAAGIAAVYSAFRERRLFIFDDLAELLDEIGTYSYAVDAQGNVLDSIEDAETYHLLDALRYLVSELTKPARSLRSASVRFYG